MKKAFKNIISLVLLSIMAVGVFATPASAAAPKEFEVISEIPKWTTLNEIVITEDEKIQEGEFSLEWEPYGTAPQYSVRVFFNIYHNEKDVGLEFIFIEEYLTETNSVTITGLKPYSRYTIVIYALDEEGNEIGIYDRLPVATIERTEEEEPPVDTAPEEEPDNNETTVKTDKEKNKNKDNSLILWVVVISVAVLVVAAVVITVILAVDKKKYKA